MQLWSFSFSFAVPILLMGIKKYSDVTELSQEIVIFVTINSQTAPSCLPLYYTTQFDKCLLFSKNFSIYFLKTGIFKDVSASLPFSYL